jgi:hypothetical protein
MSKLIDPARAIYAAYLAGCGKTLDETAEAIGIDDSVAVRQTLNLYNIRFEAKPFGARDIRVSMTKPQLLALSNAARARNIFGDDRQARVLELAARILANDLSLLDAVLDDGYTTTGGGK